MRALFILFMLGVLFSPIAATTETKKTVVLTEDNHMIVRGQVTSESVSKWILELNKIKENNIMIYISSPGGSVLAGMTFVEQIKQLEASGKHIECVADIAASMAFIIFQACPHRYTTSSSVLMQHQMSLRLGGSIENVKTYLDFLDNIESDLNEMQAKRLDMDVEAFNQKIAHDWWLSGSNILKYNVADKMIHVKCHSSLLQKTKKEEIDTFFGKIILTFSGCPLSRDPLKQDFRGINDIEMIEEIRNLYLPSYALKNLMNRPSPSYVEY
ncbi:Clp protease [seawater metagenome]|uniref:Clp protease n=1 Tax=seawater metagenome TaxID=1561972 RepID=A0A5E8CHQ2_9ZZZZ